VANELEESLKEDILTAMNEDSSFSAVQRKEKEEKSEEIIHSIKKQIDDDLKGYDIETEMPQVGRDEILKDVSKTLKQQIKTLGISTVIDSSGKVNSEAISKIVKESKEKIEATRSVDTQNTTVYETNQEKTSEESGIEFIKNMSDEELKEWLENLTEEECRKIVERADKATNGLLSELMKSANISKSDSKEIKTILDVVVKITKLDSKNKDEILEKIEEERKRLEDRGDEKISKFFERLLDELKDKDIIEILNPIIEELGKEFQKKNKEELNNDGHEVKNTKEAEQAKEQSTNSSENSNNSSDSKITADLTSPEGIVEALVLSSNGEIKEEDISQIMELLNNAIESSIMDEDDPYSYKDFENGNISKDIKETIKDVFAQEEVKTYQKIFLQEGVIEKLIEHMKSLNESSIEELDAFLDSIKPENMDIKKLLEDAKKKIKEKPVSDKDFEENAEPEPMNTTAVEEAEKVQQSQTPQATQEKEDKKQEEAENKPQLPTVYKPSFLDRVKNFFKSIRTQGIRGAFAESFMAKEWQYQQEVPKQEQAPEPPKQNDEEHGQPKGKEEQSAQNLGGDSPQAGDAPKGTNEQVSKEPTETSVEPALNGDTPPVAQEPEQSQAGDVLTSEGTAEDGSKSTDESFVPNSTVVFNPDSINKGKIEAYKKTTQDQSIFEDYDILTGNINGKEFVLLQYKKSGPEAIVQKINVGGKTYNISDISGERNCIKDFNDGGGTLLLKSVPKEIDYISRKGSEKIAEKSKKDNGKENEPKEEGR